jgi:predicted nucleotidyltransferase
LRIKGNNKWPQENWRKKYEVKTVAISGSKRGTSNRRQRRSTILVAHEPEGHFLELGGIQFDLEELLGRPVGVATP